MIIPTIGGARGIFEILVPGVFLLVNLGMVVHLLPFIDDETTGLITACVSDPVVAVVIGVVFGYLLGVILRLFRPSVPDRLSAAWLRRFDRRARKGDGKVALWASEDFPYLGLMGEVQGRFLPPETLDFYEKTWARKKHEGQFFNFCKTMISCEDKKAGIEIYAAEALVRYSSGMFYALILAFLLILITVVLRYIAFRQAMAGLIIMLCAYLFAIGAIISRFRFGRIREVETVFAASFKNRHLFEGETAGEEKAAREVGWLARLLAPRRSRR